MPLSASADIILYGDGVFATSASNRFLIDAPGGVGIGKRNPAATGNFTALRPRPASNGRCPCDGPKLVTCRRSARNAIMGLCRGRFVFRKPPSAPCRSFNSGAVFTGSGFFSAHAGGPAIGPAIARQRGEGVAPNQFLGQSAFKAAVGCNPIPDKASAFC